MRRGWKLAILSNCDRDLIATSLPKLGVEFDEVIVAEDVQSYKPAPGHWDRFDAETGADPPGTCMSARASFTTSSRVTIAAWRRSGSTAWASRPTRRPTAS